MLSPEDLPGLQRLNLSRDHLHQWMAGSPLHDAPFNVNSHWPRWKEYIATHNRAADLVGPGVISIGGEFIEGTYDPNRCQLRLDIVIRHRDGGYLRIHPGTKRSNDAEPRYFPPTGPARSASEHAREEWAAPSHDGIFTWARAQTIPQGDRMGKKAVWRIVEPLLSSNQIGLDITNGEVLRWWLWICNLGRYSRDVIGVGVIRAEVSMADRRKSATFTFYRVDSTSSRVVLASSRMEVFT